MDKQITDELTRRCDILISNAEPGEINTGMSGSRMRFSAAICTMGYPFADPPSWMDERYLEPLIPFSDDSYNDFIDDLHRKAFLAVNKEPL